MLETKRLILREWTMEDVDVLAASLNDFDIAKFLTVPFPYTKDDARRYIEKHLKNTDKDVAFAIIEKRSGQVIGGTSVRVEENKKNSGGIWLNKNYHGIGLGTEAWVARAKFIFDELGLDTIYSGFYEYNNISGKMQQKIGGKIVGKRQRFCSALNKEVTEILVELKKIDFEKFLKSYK